MISLLKISAINSKYDKIYRILPPIAPNGSLLRPGWRIWVSPIFMYKFRTIGVSFKNLHLTRQGFALYNRRRGLHATWWFGGHWWFGEHIQVFALDKV